MMNQTAKGATLATCQVGAGRAPWGARYAGRSLTFAALALCLSTSIPVRAQEPVLPIPKPALPGEGRNVALQPVLSAEDAETYRRIFALQVDGRLREADEALGRLSDPILVGHVLAARYLNADKAPGADKLQAWMKAYGDHPDLAAIQDMAAKAGLSGIKTRKAKPVLTNGEDEGPPDDSPYVSPKPRTHAEAAKVDALMNKIAKLANKGQFDAAAKLLEGEATKARLDTVEVAMTRARLAKGHYFAGNLTEAAREAVAAAPLARGESPTADWIAGLSLWRLNQFDQAADHFDQVSRSSKADSWLAAAGAFWAARAEVRARRPERVPALLARAAEQGRTFYGLIAARQLGIEDRFNWGLPVLTQEAQAKLDHFAGVRRARALVEVGQAARAESELALIQSRIEPALRRPLLAMARRLDLAAAQFRIAGRVRGEGETYDAALYPIPGFKPQGGFSVERALIYALMRQESRFDAGARNGRSGATGLMQIMPETAKRLTGASVKPAKLDDPSYNLALAQRYLDYLSDNLGGMRNLFLVAAAYNAGPGNLARWREGLRDVDDPLLFIESLPAAQTRAFVARVAASYWIYRIRLDQGVPSLDAAAAGKWPCFNAASEENRVRMVRN